MDSGHQTVFHTSSGEMSRLFTLKSTDYQRACSIVGVWGAAVYSVPSALPVAARSPHSSKLLDSEHACGPERLPCMQWHPACGSRNGFQAVVANCIWWGIPPQISCELMLANPDLSTHCQDYCLIRASFSFFSSAPLIKTTFLSAYSVAKWLCLVSQVSHNSEMKGPW